MSTLNNEMLGLMNIIDVHVRHGKGKFLMIVWTGQKNMQKDWLNQLTRCN